MSSEPAARSRDRVFFQALLKLDRYIEENIRDEGFLPSEAKLCEVLGVSRITCRAVLAASRKNGFIVSYPKKGHYVLPKEYRVKKVGLVVDSGKESPFLANGKIVSSIIGEMEDQFINCQVIQSSVGENLKWRALAHGVRGLVWVLPASETIPLIQGNNDEIPFPQVIVSWNRHRISEKDKGEVPILGPDSSDAAARKAEFFLQRGHQKILFLDGHDVEKKAVTRVFRKAGVSWSRRLYFENNADWEDDLKALVEEQAFTAAIIPGGPRMCDSILRILDAYPGDSPPEIIIPVNYMMAYFREKYPRINFVASTEFEWDKLGRVTAEALSRRILEGTPIQSQRLKMHCLKMIP